MHRAWSLWLCWISGTFLDIVCSPAERQYMYIYQYTYIQMRTYMCIRHIRFYITCFHTTVLGATMQHTLDIVYWLIINCETDCVILCMSYFADHHTLFLYLTYDNQNVYCDIYRVYDVYTLCLLQCPLKVILTMFRENVSCITNYTKLQYVLCFI